MQDVANERWKHRVLALSLLRLLHHCLPPVAASPPARGAWQNLHLIAVLSCAVLRFVMLCSADRHLCARIVYGLLTDALKFDGSNRRWVCSAAGHLHFPFAACTVLRLAAGAYSFRAIGCYHCDMHAVLLRSACAGRRCGGVAHIAYD